MIYPWNLETVTYADIEQLRYEVAVLPVGAIEPHGKHLPYGEDFFCATAIADRSCRSANEQGARTIRLPAIPYGVDSNLLAFPFAMNVRQSTLNRVAADVMDSLVHHGVHKLVIFNGHGGNEFKSFLREHYGRPDIFVCLINWWTVGGDVGRELFTHEDDHAGEMEASVSLHLFPDLVHLERAGDGSTRKTDFRAINEGWVQITRPWHLFTKDSNAGDARLATAEKGERYVRVSVERIAQFLVELSATPYDERFPYGTQFA